MPTGQNTYGFHFHLKGSYLNGLVQSSSSGSSPPCSSDPVAVPIQPVRGRQVIEQDGFLNGRKQRRLSARRVNVVHTKDHDGNGETCSSGSSLGCCELIKSFLDLPHTVSMNTITVDVASMANQQRKSVYITVKYAT